MHALNTKAICFPLPSNSGQIYLRAPRIHQKCTHPIQHQKKVSASIPRKVSVSQSKPPLSLQNLYIIFLPPQLSTFFPPILHPYIPSALPVSCASISLMILVIIGKNPLSFATPLISVKNPDGRTRCGILPLGCAPPLGCGNPLPDGCGKPP